MGKEKKTFSLHREAITGVLPAFKTMLSDVHGRRVLWPSVQVDTFISLAQFAYTGDYVLTGHGMDGAPTATINQTKDYKESVDVKKMKFSALFLGHARLYALATTYKADDLKHLAHRKLGHIFNYFDDYINNHSGSLDSLLELAEYAFSSDHYHAEGDDDLRELVLHYIIANIHWVGWDKGYVKMLKTGGAFANMFWAKALKVIHELEPSTEH